MKHFTHPLTYENLQEFCSPQADSCFATPWGNSDHTFAANGYCAIRYNRTFGLENNEEAATRVQTLPWRFFDKDTRNDQWGNLDLVRGGIWRNGPLEPFGKTPDGAWYARVSRCTLVGDSFVCLPTPILQLITKLPRCEVFKGSASREWLYFRFNGGEGIAKGLKRAASHHIFQPKTGLL